ncbi:hypothetical protein FHR83_002815 [Actinoplanes campanulatus]|uniref:ABC-2 family transporter protein n=1 Tax=Actinoplanes campanulatus TaxID=113559 RepID=A0A7W5AFL0_9ACTN|nr:hypothetical protein [Actinoplanes campanulatus]MBB3095152.1 hypothetical protein [Actinoplanes campanulatus]GGN23828.1 hypothetical protein GCM10010109_38970 [Actinoplanes campanulatus]GID34756.1 hypothetical protein Aca09nite_12620 [Actinoplanes campanulatus]
MNAVRAEVGKLLTLRSLALTLGLTWAVTLLLDALDPPGGSVLPYGQVGFLILGVLATAHEYQGGGQIRTTLLAMPRRYRLAAAKAVALVVLAAPAALLVAGTAGEPGGALSLVVDTLVAAGVGLLIRRPVGAAGAVLIAYEIGLPLIRTHWGEVNDWLPLAGVLIFAVASVVFARRDGADGS